MPLDAINAASAKEKSIRHGHPSTLHLWWARRPLAACRAVIFASLVDDPSSHPDRFPTEEAQAGERRRLFNLIESFVQWENIEDEELWSAVKNEVEGSTGVNPPPILDPFSGGGSIPLEAQRLGLAAAASDLNPVAVVISKALIEWPSKLAGLGPVNPEARKDKNKSAIPPTEGLAKDLELYGALLAAEARGALASQYPTIRLPDRQAMPAIAWIWARSVACPNPACRADLPLVKSFWLSRKPGKETWIEPVVDRNTTPPAVRFTVKGRPMTGTAPTETVLEDGAKCLACSQIAPLEHVRTEARAGRMKQVMMAVAAAGTGTRHYVAPDEIHLRAAAAVHPDWEPDTRMEEGASELSIQGYGIVRHADLFTLRQLQALGTYASLVSRARKRILADARRAGLGEMADGYADAVTTYLGLCASRLANYNSTLCIWSPDPKNELVVQAFRRQAIGITWDFAESNPLGSSSGSFELVVKHVAKVIRLLPAGKRSTAVQQDARKLTAESGLVVATDPPYYDYVGYANLSDFFYIWMRRGLGAIYPDLFGSVLVPKEAELVANPARQGGKQAAMVFFEDGLFESLCQARRSQHPGYPLSIFYAYKQGQSAGWEKMLEALIKAGLCITGTWPLRTEDTSKLKGKQNSLTSSIVLVCRVRPEGAPVATRRDFVVELAKVLPDAIRTLREGRIAPVDLAQASLGPGMAVFTRYAKVVEADGTAMSVKTALSIINQTLEAVLSEQEGDFDAPTRWCLAWYEQFGFGPGEYGAAETLSKAKSTSIEILASLGLVEAHKGRVRLSGANELPEDGKRLDESLWGATQALILALDTGEVEAARLLNTLGPIGTAAATLAYELYAIAARDGRAAEARTYNALIQSWPEITRLAGLD